MKSFKIIYDPNGGVGTELEPTTVVWGDLTPLRKNTYQRKGYEFIGWAAYRSRDQKLCYMNKENRKRRFYSVNEQPEGWVLQVYPDQYRVSKLSPCDNDIVTLYAQWKECIDYSQRTIIENKAGIENNLLNRPIILYGEENACNNFYYLYHEKLNIKCILLDEVNESSTIKSPVEVKAFKNKEISKDDYIIICCHIKAREDNEYKIRKKKLLKASFVITEDFVRSDVAEMILEKKKFWLWLGFCQVDTLRTEIFQKLKSISDRFVLVFFRYGLDTLKNSYKFDDFIECLKICDCLSYVPLIFDEGKTDLDFNDYLPVDATRISLPRIPFQGYYPYREPDMESFHPYQIDGKLHWPFGYTEKIIDDLILSGKSDDEIYDELMREDLIPEKDIQKNLSLSYKFIHISEATTDIKMLDFIEKNFHIRLLYRDGLHYQNCMYFELARRVSAFLNLDCEDEINELEKVNETKGKQFIDYTEVPILPCVAKSLNLDFVTEDTLYRVRFSENGARWGTKVIIKEMTRKEWIYLYIKYTRACMTLCEFWLKIK